MKSRRIRNRRNRTIRRRKLRGGACPAQCYVCRGRVEVQGSVCVCVKCDEIQPGYKP